MTEYIVMYTEPGTGVVMYRDRVRAASREAAMREARDWIAKRPSLQHWGVTVEEPRPKVRDGDA